MKAKIHKLDSIFRIFEVDDSLPDPELYAREFFERPKPVGRALAESFRKQLTECQNFPESEKMMREVFRKHVILDNPYTGARLWVWIPVDVGFDARAVW